MKKMIVAGLLLTFSNIVFAQHCPQPSEVTKIENGKVIPVAPPGWRIGWKHTFDNSDVQFAWAAWAEKRIDPQDERKVLCIYGNPNVEAHGLILVSLDTLPISAIESHTEWRSYGGEPGNRYFRCDANKAEKCPFGFTTKSK